MPSFIYPFITLRLWGLLTNKATMTIPAQAFASHILFFSWSRVPGSACKGMFKVLRHCQSGSTILYFCQQSRRVPVPPHPKQLDIVSVSRSSHSKTSVVVLLPLKLETKVVD